jgi:nucleoside-diphosphate-sugar epimerase
MFSDIRRFIHATGWVPQISVQQGVDALYVWLCQGRGGTLGQRLAAANVG